VAPRPVHLRRLWPARGRRVRVAGVFALALALALAACGTSAPPRVPKPKRLALVYRGPHGNLILASAAGSELRTLGRASQALVSPDGTRVLALRDVGSGTATLTLYNTNRAGAARVIATLGPPDWAGSTQLLGWSPDSRYVAFTAYTLSSTGEQGVLVVLNTASGQLTTVATGNFLGGAFAPTLPDRLVYSDATVDQLDNNESLLYVTSPSGQGTRRLTRSGLASAPAWSARGIVFARLLRLGNRSSSPLYTLSLIQPNGHGRHRLDDFAAGAPAPDAHGAALVLSANGKRLVADFYSPVAGSQTIESWAFNLSARHPVARPLVLPDAGVVAEGISRNGKSILAAIYGASGPQIASLRWDGGAARTLASAASDANWNS
jgi:WD40 repeat protein